MVKLDLFSHHQPARAAFQVAALPKGGDIEIEAVAIIGEKEKTLYTKYMYILLRFYFDFYNFRCC